MRPHTDWNDPSARFGAYIMSVLVFGLIIMSALDRWPAAVPVQAAQPMRGPLIVVTATPALPLVSVPTPAAPIATAAPLPTQAPIIEVRYVEVPVYVPATVDSPPIARPVETHYQEVAVPPGAVQVSVAPPGEQPIVSSIHSSEVELDRPARLNRGESSGQVVAP